MNHVGALRVSLLIAIRAVPVACGGTVDNLGGDGADSGSGGEGNVGNTGTAGGGRASTGGRTNTGGTVGKMLPPIGGMTAGGAGGTTFGPSTCTNPKVDPLS